MRHAICLAPTALLIAVLPACQQPHGPIFPRQDAALVWPRPPDTPRIRYIGELTGESSLRAGTSGWPRLSEWIAGPKPTIAFSTPMSVAVRGDVVFVADGQNQAVFRLDLAARTIQTISHADGKPLQGPIDLAATADRLAVADNRRAAVFLFDLQGEYRATLGEGLLQRPSAVAWDSANARWWVLDTAAHACLIFDADGTHLKTVGRRGGAAGDFNYPAGMVLHPAAGAVIADSMNFRVQRLDAEGAPVLSFGQKGDAAGDFSMPRDAAVDSEGHVYVLDNQFENVQIFDPQGRLLMAFGEEGRGPGQFYLPSGITIDEQDRIWIADTYNRRVQVFQYLSRQEP